MEESFGKQLNAIWAGQMAPADAVKQAVGAINEILRQPAA